METEETYKRARRKVEAKIWFYIHLAVFILVNILLLIVNLTTSPQYLWFKWPLIGWGIGLFFHGLSVFVGSRFQRIKERMIKEQMKKEQG